MAKEAGEIRIIMAVDERAAIYGLQKAQAALDETGDKAGKFGKDVAKGADTAADGVQSGTNRTQRALGAQNETFEKGGKAAERFGSRAKKAFDDPKMIKGLDDLRDKSGEFDSSIKGLGGGIGLFSKKGERATFVMGELAGGLEGGTRLTKLFKTGISAAISPVGLLGAATIGLGTAFFLMSRDAKQAKIDVDELDGAIKAATDTAQIVEDTKLDIEIEKGELTALEKQFINLERNVKEKFAPAIKEAAEPFKEFQEAVEKANEKVLKKERELNKIRAKSGTGARLREKELWKLMGKRAEAVGKLEEAQKNELSAAGKAYQEVQRNLKKEMEQQEELLLIKIHAAQKDEDAAKEKLKSDKAKMRGRENDVKAAEADRKAAALQAELDAKRLRLEDMIAAAQGKTAQANLAYRRELAEIIELQNQLGITAEQAGALVLAADERRLEAIDAGNTKADEALDKRKADALKLVQLTSDETQVIKDEYNEREKAIDNALKANLITEQQASDKLLELEQQKNDKLDALQRERAQQTLANITKGTDQVTALLDATIQHRQERLAQEEAAALKRAEGNEEAQDKIKEKFEKRRSAELSRLFKARKAMEVANALISGASAAIAALAPPPVGLGPVAGPFLAGTIAATTAAQVAVISQQQPAFHQGGIVGGNGDTPIMAQGGEVVLNRDTVAALGGPDAANRLNDRAGGGSVVVEMTYRGRLFDRMVVDNLAKRGPLKKALNRATKRGMRGRIGGRL